MVIWLSAGGVSGRAGGIINGAIRRRKGINNMNAKKTKHTPGPWKVSDKMMTDELVCRHDTLGAWVYSCRYIEGAGKLLATAQSDEPIGAGRKGGHPQVESRDEMLANARLIAAAPDLLDALKGLFEHCTMIHRVWGDGSNRKEADAAIAAGKAAIAKAEGRG
jgi:hypothetical protein